MTNRVGPRMETASTLSRIATGLPASGPRPLRQKPIGLWGRLWPSTTSIVRQSILNVGYTLMNIAVTPDKTVLNLDEMTNIWMAMLAEDQQK